LTQDDPAFCGLSSMAMVPCSPRTHEHTQRLHSP
jgi:hypothetical protein